MPTNITYRQATQTPPASTTTKNAPLTNAEVDGNIASLVSAVDGAISALSGKQVVLVSATNIKTVNSTTLLGSGDLVVQPTLVSGTNIKTVGGLGLLGSGDITNPNFAGPVLAYSFSPTSSTVPTNGFYLPAGNTLAITTNSIESIRFAADNSITLGGPVATPAFKVTPVASQVNYVNANGAATTNGVSVEAKGTDTNIGLNFIAKGTGNIGFFSGGFQQLVVTATASANRWVSFTGSFNGNPGLSATAGNLSLNSPTVTSQGLFNTKITMAANDINLNLGNMFTKTIAGATTLTVSNVPVSGLIASFILDLTNGGSAVITWWSGMKWANGAAPTLTVTGRDLLGFITYDGGATWNGYLIAKGMA
jgi:hypothetical protein